MLARQGLLDPFDATIRKTLTAIGAIQAQYAPSTYVGPWSRLGGAVERDAPTRALEWRTVIQATLMRSTIHLVAKRDFWPFALAPRAARRALWLRSMRGGTDDGQMRELAARVREHLAQTGEPISRKELRPVAAGTGVCTAAGSTLAPNRSGRPGGGSVRCCRRCDVVASMRQQCTHRAAGIRRTRRDPAAPVARMGCMNRIHVTLTATAAAVIAAAGIALASGGPPPVQPADPDVDTVVSTATAQSAVRAPARRSNATIEAAVRAARARALPRAVAGARSEASALAAAAGLSAGDIVAIRRDSSPLGYWDQDSGRFGPGVWCGRLYVGRRVVRRADGTTTRKSSFRHGCPVPKTASIRVTLTFAARPG